MSNDFDVSDVDTWTDEMIQAALAALHDSEIRNQIDEVTTQEEK